MTKTCCVTGHRDLPEECIASVRERLREEILLAMEDGYTTFLSGFAQGVDLLFAELVLELGEDDPAIALEAAIPYRGRLRQGGYRFQRLLEQCVAVYVYSEEYDSQCFHKRNRAMVERCGRVIAVHDGRAGGGTAYTIQYAQKLGRELRLIRSDRQVSFWD